MSVLLSANGLAVLLLGSCRAADAALPLLDQGAVALPGGGARLRYPGHEQGNRAAGISAILSEQPEQRMGVPAASCCTCAAHQVRLPDGARPGVNTSSTPRVMVIPLLKMGELVMERQYRYPLRRDVLELPAASSTRARRRSRAGRRELLEETGYVASSWRHLWHHPSVVGYSDERIEIYLAQGLNAAGGLARPRRAPGSVYAALETALEWVREGRITDARP